MKTNGLFNSEDVAAENETQESFSADFFDMAQDEKTLRVKLEELGRLPLGFDVRWLLPLLKHKSSDVRLLAVKNIGKDKPEFLLDDLRRFAQSENNTLVRREAVSAIGRMRSQRAIPVLTNFLHDQDAKIVLQAIRGLLPFKTFPKVQDGFATLANHPNELIQDVIHRAIETEQSKTATIETQHHVSAAFLKNLLVHGDVREILPSIPNDSIHLTFTSPPYYNARDYTIYQSYEGYLQLLADIFKEVHRVTKEGRFFALNTSPVLVPRMSCSHSSTRYAR